MKLSNPAKLIIAIIACEGAGAIGSIFTAPAIGGWYAGLVKPELAPPNWVFGPVWTTLFALMGIAIFLVWKRRGLHNAAVAMFGTQLLLNIAWSVIFFGFKNPGMAFIEIIVLWLAILACLIAFAKISRAAAGLLVPYLAWVGFAAYLNFMIWTLNS